MKSDEERKSLNQTLIPRDIGDLTKKRKELFSRAGAASRSPDGMAPTHLGTSTSERRAKRAAEEGAPENQKKSQASGETDNQSDDSLDKPIEDQSEKKPAKEEDYAKAYLKKKAEQEKTERDKQKNEAADHAIEQNKKLREETDQRVRARDIQNQIRMWEGKKGQAGYDDTQVDGMLSSLKSQLNGIDPKFWY